MKNSSDGAHHPIYSYPEGSIMGKHRLLRSRAKFSTGLGLVELLLALAISSMLLVGVGVAFQASLNTVEENQEIALATQGARIVLHRMMSETRQADAVDCTSNCITIYPPLSTGIDMAEYELADGTLWYRQTVGGNTESYPVLAPSDGVMIHSFFVDHDLGSRTEAMIDEDTGDEIEYVITYTARCTASLDLEVDGNRFAVTASTNPRKNMDW